MVNKKTLISLGLLLIVITSIMISVVWYKSAIKDNQEHCIEKGSVEHQVRYSSDYPLAKRIEESGNKLGSYFNYNFCD